MVKKKVKKKQVKSSLEQIRKERLKNMRSLAKKKRSDAAQLQREALELENEIEVLAGPKKKKSKSYGRTKGLGFERDVANELKHVFPEAARQLEFQTDQANGVDLRETGPFRIQCKNYADYVAISKINEIKYSKTTEIPVLVTKGKNKPPMAILPFEHFVAIIEKFSWRKK